MFNNSLNFNRQRIIYSYNGSIPWTVACCLQFLMAMIGNFLIVWIVYKDNRLKTTTNYLIANMAVSDLIPALFAFPKQIVLANFQYISVIYAREIGNALCKLTFFTIDTSMAVSVYSCVAIAIDRYFAVAYPLKRPFEGKIRRVIAVIWITALVYSSPNLYLVEYCAVFDWSSWLRYIYVGAALSCVLPLMFITITYIFTTCKLYRRNIVPGLQNLQRRRREQQKKKVLKQAMTIVFLLIISKGFLLVVTLLSLQGKLYHLERTDLRHLRDAAYILYYFSLVYNFFVYLIFNDIYRENIKALISKCCCRDASRRVNNNRN